MTNYVITVQYDDTEIFNLGSVSTMFEANKVIDELNKIDFINRSFVDFEEDKDKYQFVVTDVQERTASDMINYAIGYMNWVEKGTLLDDWSSDYTTEKKGEYKND